MLENSSPFLQEHNSLLKTLGLQITTTFKVFFSISILPSVLSCSLMLYMYLHHLWAVCAAFINLKFFTKISIVNRKKYI